MRGELDMGLDIHIVEWGWGQGTHDLSSIRPVAIPKKDVSID
jgi:hypothetical protein